MVLIADLAEGSHGGTQGEAKEELRRIHGRRDDSSEEIREGFEGIAAAEVSGLPDSPPPLPPNIAQIMRSYLDAGNGNPSAGEAVAEAAAAEGCGAVMEVMKTFAGGWVVCRFSADHTHPLSPPRADASGALAAAGLVPVVGMGFESISMAKAFYQTYSEKMGFKAKAGAGRRGAPDDGTLVVQRFYCSKGSYPPSKRRRNADDGESRCARFPVALRKIAPNLAKSGQAAEAIPRGGGLTGDECQATEKDLDFTDKPSELVQNNAGGVLAEKNLDLAGCEGGRWKEAGKMPLVSNPGQSRLLRELGIRVSRYTHEERRDIITRYIKKRSGRQVVDRSLKVQSRQALAERRQRGVGGKFLSKEGMEMQVPTRQDETLVEEPDVLAEEVECVGGVPIVGMVFENEDKAYDHYVKYAADMGFSVRKGWWDKSSKNITRTRVYVCSKEGFRTKNEETKRSRTETRTGCSARLAIKITSSKKYQVAEFVSEHNHPLAAPLDIQMLASKRILTKSHAGGQQGVSRIPAGCKNYIGAKRMRPMQPRDAGTVLRYLQKMKGEDPSFYYAIQVDESDRIANIFWADMKSMIDFYYFGDAVCFDTTSKVNDFGTPLVLFHGVNHHRQTIVFGAALMYDETVDSFKWLFESFKSAMCGRQPKTMLTEQNTAIVDALASVCPDTQHRISIWHLHQTSLHLLSDYFQASEIFVDDFCRCLYEVEEEVEFLSAWSAFLEKYNVESNEWLIKLYEERENWALVYGRHMFCADLESTLLQSQSLSHLLKGYLSSETDLSHFLLEYERLLDERRSLELQYDRDSNQITPRIAPLRLLWQTANSYTPASFAMFQREFDLFLHCIIFSCSEAGMFSDYEVSIKDKPKGHFVRFDSSDGSFTCSCRKFEFVGVQCCHVLKVMDFRNIKELPPKYILKRWRKDAKIGITSENASSEVAGLIKFPLLCRYNSLCRDLSKISARAAESHEAFAFMLSQSDQLLEQVERLLQTELIEKPSQSNTSKCQSPMLVENGILPHDRDNENQKTNGRRKNVAIRRNEQEANKRKKVQNGTRHPEELAVSGTEARDIEPVTQENDVAEPRISPNQFLAARHFMQATYTAGHPFGLGATHGFYSMTQFGQDSSVSGLHQQHFHTGAHLNQSSVPPFSTHDIALQFVGSNPQLDQQGGGDDQGHCAVPVWDFL